MEKVWMILIELSFLSLLGLLYYVFQKKRIIKFTINEIYIHADQLIYQCHEQIENLKNSNEKFEELEKFVEAFEAEIELEEIDSLKEFLISNQPKIKNETILGLIVDIKNMLGINPTQ